MVVLKESIFKLQKAFVTERAELIDNNRKKWDTSMLQRRDKEVMVESIHTFPITPMLVGNHSTPMGEGGGGEEKGRPYTKPFSKSCGTSKIWMWQ